MVCHADATEGMAAAGQAVGACQQATAHPTVQDGLWLSIAWRDLLSAKDLHDVYL